MPHIFRLFFAVATVFVVAAALLGCSPRYQPPLTVGTNTWIGYEPLYLARDLGYYEGANLRLVELASTTQAMDALRVGSLDLAGLTLDEALLLAQEGVPIAVIWVLNTSAGADALLAKPGITTLDALRGKRIGVEQTAVGGYMLNAALAQAHLQVSDIRVVPLPLDEHWPAWQANAIDAVVTFDPVRQKILNAGGQVVFSSADIPGQIVDVLVARQSALECCRAQIERLIAGQQQALTYLREHPTPAWQHMAQRQGIAPQELGQALAGIDIPDARMNHTLLTQPDTGLAATAQYLATVMQASRLLPSPPNMADLIRADFAQKATP